MCRLPVSSTFSNKYFLKLMFTNRNLTSSSSFSKIGTWAPSDLGGKTRQALPLPSHPSSSKIFHLKKTVRLLGNINCTRYKYYKTSGLEAIKMQAMISKLQNTGDA